MAMYEPSKGLTSEQSVTQCDNLYQVSKRARRGNVISQVEYTPDNLVDLDADRPTFAPIYFGHDNPLPDEEFSLEDLDTFFPHKDNMISLN